MRDQSFRRWRRAVVKRRRLKNDLNEHYDNLNCACRTDAKVQAFFADTPTPCSCPMCGNPRRHFGELTVQERLSAIELFEVARLACDENVSITTRLPAFGRHGPSLAALQLL